MALIEKSVRRLLLDHAGVSAIVANRIYTRRMPQGVTMPAGVVWRITTPRERTHSGPSGLARTRLQVDWWCDEGSDSARLVSEQARKCLDGYRGTVEGIRIDSVAVEGDRDDERAGLELWLTSQDVLVWHDEP